MAHTSNRTEEEEESRVHHDAVSSHYGPHVEVTLLLVLIMDLYHRPLAVCLCFACFHDVWA